MMKPIYVEVAIGKNNELGNKGQLLWHLKDDLRLFKERTMNNIVIMGRKTYDSIKSSLEGRTVIVVTRNPRAVKLKKESDLIAVSLRGALALTPLLPGNSIHIAGGGEIYKAFFELDLPHVLNLTRVNTVDNIECDTFFEGVDYTKYTSSSSFSATRGCYTPPEFEFFTYVKY